jgi:hypothetical protein
VFSDKETPVEAQLGPIHGAAIAFHPVSFDPVAGLLKVSKSLSVTHSVGGGAMPPLTITKLRDAQAKAPLLQLGSE